MSHKAATKIRNYLGAGAMIMLLAITILLVQRPRSLLTVAEAQAAAEAQFAQTKTVEVELRTSQATPVYEVYLNNGRKVRIDAHSGKIVKLSKQEAND